MGSCTSNQTDRSSENSPGGGARKNLWASRSRPNYKSDELHMYSREAVFSNETGCKHIKSLNAKRLSTGESAKIEIELPQNCSDQNLSVYNKNVPLPEIPKNEDCEEETLLKQPVETSDSNTNEYMTAKSSKLNQSVISLDDIYECMLRAKDIGIQTETPDVFDLTKEVTAAVVLHENETVEAAAKLKDLQTNKPEMEFREKYENNVEDVNSEEDCIYYDGYQPASLANSLIVTRNSEELKVKGKVTPVVAKPNATERQYQLDEYREFVQVALDERSIVNWKCLTISTPNSTASSEVDKLLIGCSQHPDDFPSLANGQRCLSPVVHCRPQDAKFTDPVFIQISFSQTDKPVKLFYSTSDVVKRSIWKQFRHEHLNSNKFAGTFTDDEEIPNEAFLSFERNQMTLKLHHFSSFVVIEDRREIVMKEATIDIYMKLMYSPKESTVNVFVVLSCDPASLKKQEKLQREKLFKKVATNTFLIRDGGEGHITVNMSDVKWTDKISELDHVTSTCPIHDVLRCAMTSQFMVKSKIMNCHFSCYIRIQNTDIMDKIFSLSEDLHELPQRSRNAGMSRINCSCCPTEQPKTNQEQAASNVLLLVPTLENRLDSNITLAYSSLNLQSDGSDSSDDRRRETESCEEVEALINSNGNAPVIMWKESSWKPAEDDCAKCKLDGDLKQKIEPLIRRKLLQMFHNGLS